MESMAGQPPAPAASAEPKPNEGSSVPVATEEPKRVKKFVGKKRATTTAADGSPSGGDIEDQQQLTLAGESGDHKSSQLGENHSVCVPGGRMMELESCRLLEKGPRGIYFSLLLPIHFNGELRTRGSNCS